MPPAMTPRGSVDGIPLPISGGICSFTVLLFLCLCLPQALSSAHGTCHRCSIKDSDLSLQPPFSTWGLGAFLPTLEPIILFPTGFSCLPLVCYVITLVPSVFTVPPPTLVSDLCLLLSFLPPSGPSLVSLTAEGWAPGAHLSQPGPSARGTHLSTRAQLCPSPPGKPL